MPLITDVMVRVLRKEVYGNVLYYPVSPVAHILLKLTKSKTFTKQQLNIVGELFPVHVIIREA